MFRINGFDRQRPRALLFPIPQPRQFGLELLDGRRRLLGSADRLERVDVVQQTIVILWAAGATDRDGDTDRPRAEDQGGEGDQGVWRSIVRSLFSSCSVTDIAATGVTAALRRLLTDVRPRLTSFQLDCLQHPAETHLVLPVAVGGQRSWCRSGHCRSACFGHVILR